MSTFEIITNISSFLLLINFLLFSKSFLKQKKEAFRVLCLYLFIILVIEVYTWFLQKKGKPNLFLSHYYFVSQFFLLSVFYYKILKSKLRKLIPYLVIIITIILISSFFKNPKLYYTFFLLEVVMCSLSIVLFSIFYFLESFGIQNKKYLFLSSGIFIYLLSSTLIFSSGNLIVGLKDILNARIVWAINSILYLIYQILIFIEWYKNFRKKAPEAIT